MQKEQKNIGLIWFRNDLRTLDNNSLNKAITKSNSCIAIYCFNPNHYKQTEWGFKKTEVFRAQFLIETIENLKQELNKLNIPLLIYQEEPQKTIPFIAKQLNVTTIYCQNEWTDEEKLEYNKVKATLPNTKFITTYDQFLYHPEDVNITTNEIPKVFTVFRKGVEKNSIVRPTKTTNANHLSPVLLKNITKVPTLKDVGFSKIESNTNSAFPFKGGQSAALERLEYYTFNSNKISEYKKTRNGLIGTAYSSKLSAWLANGAISPRTVYWEIIRYEKEVKKNESTYWLIFELLWRDFFKYISLKHGNNIFKQEGILSNTYKWYNNKKAINNWINGTTTEPFVNANMIELKQTGFMSNRGRQNVASFFAKELKLDWRIGAAYFEAMLLDYDVHSNYGNWMYVSGVGNDPRDRKFNIKLQANRYDTDNSYQNLWLSTNTTH